MLRTGKKNANIAVEVGAVIHFDKKKDVIIFAPRKGSKIIFMLIGTCER